MFLMVSSPYSEDEDDETFSRNLRVTNGSAEKVVLLSTFKNKNFLKGAPHYTLHTPVSQNALLADNAFFFFF